MSETACLLTFRAVLKRNLAIKFTPAPDGRPNQQDGLPFVFFWSIRAEIYIRGRIRSTGESAVHFIVDSMQLIAGFLALFFVKARLKIWQYVSVSVVTPSAKVFAPRYAASSSAPVSTIEVSTSTTRELIQRGRCGPGFDSSVIGNYFWLRR